MDLSADVLFPDGIENMGGITKKAYIGFVSDFTTIQKPTDAPAAYADVVTIATAHVLAVGKKTIEVYVMYDKSGVEAPSQGTRKGMSYKPKVTLVQPGNQAECLGLASIMKNADVLLFLTPQDGGDYFIQVGSEDLPASMTSSTITTGTSPEAEKSVTMVFEAPSRQPYYMYTADLPRLGAA
jgi:hypothetical protein